MTTLTADPPPVRPGATPPAWDNANHAHDSTPTRPVLVGMVPPVMDNDYWAAYPDTLTTADVAKILRVGETAIFRRLKNGTVPAHRIGSSWIIFKAEVRAWIESTSNRAATTPPDPMDVLADYADEMNYRDLMTLLGKTKQTIYIWLRNGEIPAYHAAGNWIIYKNELRKLLADTTNQSLNAAERADTPTDDLK